MSDYHTEWCKEHTTQFKLRLNNNTDADIIEFLNALPNKQGYIKELIRNDRRTNMKTVKETIENIKKYKGYLPLQIFDTTDLKAIAKELCESDDMEPEEADELLRSDTWVYICSDGVIILADAHDADFEWHGIHYSVQNDRWTETRTEYIPPITLRQLLHFMDDETAVTIHQGGEYDGDYLYISDVEDDLLDKKVIKIETPADPQKTNLRITIK